MRVGINVQRRAVAPPMWRRANERRRRAMSPMTSVAARGPGRQRRRRAAESPGVRARRRERATISDRRCGLAAASLSQPRRHQRGRATGCSPGDGRAGTVAAVCDMRRRRCRSAGGRRREDAADSVGGRRDEQ